MVKILIADSNLEFCSAMEESFGGRYTVLFCHDGKIALKLINAEKPDVLWLDMMLPGMDGIGILQAAVIAGIPLKTIACVRHWNDNLSETLFRLGVFWVTQKPCEPNAARTQLGLLINQVQDERKAGPRSPEQVAYDVLLNLGLTGRRSGHKSLLAALTLQINDPDRMVTKILYPEVASICDCSAQSVERGIRCVITAAWEKHESPLWDICFPEYTQRSPSNGVLIDRLAERARAILQDEQTRKSAFIKSMEILK